MLSDLRVKQRKFSSAFVFGFAAFYFALIGIGLRAQVLQSKPESDPNLKFCDDWIGEYAFKPHGATVLRIQKSSEGYVLSYREEGQNWDKKTISATPDPGSRDFAGEGGYLEGTCSLKVPIGLLVKLKPGSSYTVTSKGGGEGPFTSQKARSGYILYGSVDGRADGNDLYPVPPHPGDVVEKPLGPPAIKMGLWEMDGTMKISMHKGSETSSNEGKVVSRACFTPDAWRVQGEDIDQDCESPREQLDGKRYTFDITCLSNSIALHVDAVYDTNISGHFRLQSTSSSKENGMQLDTQTTSTMRFIGTNCGSVKPGKPQDLTPQDPSN